MSATGGCRSGSTGSCPTSWLDRILPNIKVEADPDDLDAELRRLGQPGEPTPGSDLEDIFAGRR